MSGKHIFQNRLSSKYGIEADHRLTENCYYKKRLVKPFLTVHRTFGAFFTLKIQRKKLDLAQSGTDRKNEIMKYLAPRKQYIRPIYEYNQTVNLDYFTEISYANYSQWHQCVVTQNSRIFMI
jgi:hypothetical protein